MGVSLAVKVAAVRVLGLSDAGDGTVELPILAVADALDLSRAAGGKGRISITPELLAELAANFERWPGPVPINVAPHREFAETAGAAPGFVEGLAVRGDELWARVWLCRDLMDEVRQGLWRGFSVDMARDVKLPTVELQGWALWGGVFTNRPAAPVNFKYESDAAASIVERACVRLSLLPARPEKETRMSDEKAPALAALEAQLNNKDEQIASLQAKLDTALADAATLREQIGGGKDENVKLSAELQASRANAVILKANLDKANEQLDVTSKALAETRAKLQSNVDTKLGEDVVRLIHAAIDRGVKPAMFDGHDHNPITWFKERFVSLESFQSFLDNLPATESKPVSSGKPADTAAHLSADVKARLEALGIDPAYAAVTDASQLKRVKQS